MIQTIRAIAQAGVRTLIVLTSRSFQKALTSFSTFALVVALMLIIWKGPWAEAYQGKQLDILGMAFAGAIAVWGICTLHTRNAVRDLNFKAGMVEASVDFNETKDILDA